MNFLRIIIIQRFKSADKLNQTSFSLVESVSVEVDFISPYAIRIKSPVYGTGMGMPSRILAELQSLLAKQINKVKEDPVVQPFLLANHILTFLHKKYPLNDSFVDADYTAYVSATDKYAQNPSSSF